MPSCARFIRPAKDLSRSRIGDRARGCGSCSITGFLRVRAAGRARRPRSGSPLDREAEPGVEYAIVLSTCAGLWSYVLGDTIRLLSRDPPRLLVTGRTSYFLSVWGEHLSGDEIERAVLDAASRAGVTVAEFSAGPSPEAMGGAGRHVLVVEFAGAAPSDPDRFGADLDRALSALNDDYRAHREGGQLLPPWTVIAPRGCFTRWMAARGRLGGQNKIPRVITDPALLRSLLEAARAKPTSGPK